MFFVSRRSSGNEPILPTPPDSKEEDGISTSISDTVVYLSSDSRAGEGNGTLFLTKRHLAWLSSNDLNKGFGLSYASLNTHSVCTDHSEFPADCLLLSIDSKSSSDSSAAQDRSIGHVAIKNDSSQMSVDGGSHNSHYDTSAAAAVQSPMLSDRDPVQYISGIAYVRIVFKTKKILDDMYYTLSRLVDAFEANEAKMSQNDDEHVAALLDDIENSLTFLDSVDGATGTEADHGQFEDAEETYGDAQQTSSSETDMVVDSKTNRKNANGK